MPTCFLAPDPIQGTFLIPGTNTPGASAQVFFFANLSTTHQTVYKDPLGATAHTNPIVLDAGGNIPSGAEVWFVQGQTYTVVYAPATDIDPPASPYRTLDNQTGMNDASLTQSEWVAAPTPSFVGASSFTVAGDQTATGLADVGRRMKFTVTAGTVYGTITARSFGAGVTTITMDMDGTQALDSGLSAAFYGLLTATNGSIPGVEISTGGVWTFQKAVNETQGADLPSSSSVNLTAATGNLVDITGTTTITSFALVQGAERTVRFASTAALVHGATLVLPNAANITTAAGDFAIFRGYAANVVRCVMYQKENLFKAPTRQVFTTGSGTYLTPSRSASINVRLIGGGGGGSANNGAAGNNGTSTTFSTLTGGGGGGATGGGTSGGVGGTATGGDINIAGGSGGSGGTSPAGTVIAGGNGGCGPFGGGGGGDRVGAANSGGGGGGGQGSAGTNGGGGGGAGGYVESRFNAPASSYAYLIGPGGSGSTGGGGNNGANGGSGIIIVDEFY